MWWIKKIIYRIKEGNHYASGLVWRSIKNFLSPMFGKSEMLFYATFSPNCAYESDPDGWGLQWNKLYGFSRCGMVHDNSVRFGWRYFEGDLEVCAYVYNKGDRIIYPFNIDLLFDAEYLFSIDLTGEYAYFTVITPYGVKVTETIRINRQRYFLAYRDFPYFGGQVTAPHDMDITVQELL